MAMAMKMRMTDQREIMMVVAHLDEKRDQRCRKALP